jgi:hypothetical protein
VDRGRAYLAEIASDANDARVKYIGFGIGGNRQAHAIVSPLSDAYPAGFDPQATAGNAYRKEYPIDPLIETLERPVRISGGSLPYNWPPDPGDVWLVQPPPPSFTTTFTPSTPAETTEGSVDLVGAFPGTLDGKTITLKVVDDGSQFAFATEQTVTFVAPVDSADVLTQIETQTTGIHAFLGPADGLMLESFEVGTIAKIRITGGTALTDLGTSAETVVGGTPGEVIYRAIIDTTAGDILGLGGPHGPFTMMPLSEVALILNDADPNSVVANGYEPVVAYFSFGTIPLVEDSQLELFWKVRF